MYDEPSASVSRSECARSCGAWQRTNWQNEPSGVSYPWILKSACMGSSPARGESRSDTPG
jgi:hypothetical protein